MSTSRWAGQKESLHARCTYCPTTKNTNLWTGNLLESCSQPRNSRPTNTTRMRQANKFSKARCTLTTSSERNVKDKFARWKRIYGNSGQAQKHKHDKVHCHRQTAFFTVGECNRHSVAATILVISDSEKCYSIQRHPQTYFNREEVKANFILK